MFLVRYCVSHTLYFQGGLDISISENVRNIFAELNERESCLIW